MIKIKIVAVGKTKEKWLLEALEEYIKRLKPVATIEFAFVKDDQQLVSYLEQEEYPLICLDAQGQQLNSDQFAESLQRQLERHGPRLTWVIGGSEGLPASIQKRYPLISLSQLTFTHQLVRLVLVEQLYRAFEILKGSQYHK